MDIFTGNISISTGNDLDIKDITDNILDIVKKSNIKDKVVLDAYRIVRKILN